jgi:starch phosphorylase
MAKGNVNRLPITDRVRSLAMNLWWSWNPAAQSLFAALDPLLWEATHHNPIKLLTMLSTERRTLLESDPTFHARLAACEHELHTYLSAETWFHRTHKSRGAKPLVAYFCSEFAVHECLPQYSGGLGVLAGDHVKSASDLGVPIVGVGLLYRCGYYTQEFAADGSTRVIYPEIDFTQVPITNTGKVITVPMARGRVHAQIWKQQVGRVSLYLLNTDIPENTKQDRQLTRHLYGGDREYRIRQEILLGIGGLMALDELGLKPTAFHMNEGHAAFCALERLRRANVSGLPLNKAVNTVRSAGVFTTHTPVPAGNDRFEPAMAWKYLSGFATDMKMSKDELLALGREEPSTRTEEFCMTVLALKLSGHCNGVAKLHGDTSRKMWARTFNLSDPDAVPIGSITNGVHSETWLAPEIRPMYDRYLKPKWVGASHNGDAKHDWWAAADKIPPQELWAMRTLLRRRMIAFVRQRLAQQIVRRNGSTTDLANIYNTLDDNTLTIGFARRFATYKRAPLIFKDAKRLAAILGNSAKPVQLIFAGKAHPKDTGGQEFAQAIYRHAAQTAFHGKVVLLEDYDMELGRILTSGCDVWLNNPLRPQEASGTSGMKPPLHGGINCSILDGWWPEAFNGKNGWSIGDGRTFTAQPKQDRYDATCIYELLEMGIVPEFYDRDHAGLPHKWAARMLESMRTVCGQFSSHRMVAEYWQRYYAPASGVQ